MQAHIMCKKLIFKINSRYLNKINKYIGFIFPIFKEEGILKIDDK